MSSPWRGSPRWASLRQAIARGVASSAFFRDGAAGGGSFGYQTGDGTGTLVYAVFAAEHDSTSYTNNTGATVSVSQIRLFNIQGVRSGATATVKAALYADDGSNAPGALLAQSGTQSVVHGVTTAVTFTLGSSVNVPNGTRVWVVFDTTDDIFFDGATHADDGRFRYKTTASSTFSDPFGVSLQFGLIIPATLQ